MRSVGPGIDLTLSLQAGLSGHWMRPVALGAAWSWQWYPLSIQSVSINEQMVWAQNVVLASGWTWQKRGQFTSRHLWKSSTLVTLRRVSSLETVRFQER